MPEKDQPRYSRRSILRRSAYSAPAIFVIAAAPEVALGASGPGNGGNPGGGNPGGGNPGGGNPGGGNPGGNPGSFPDAGVAPVNATNLGGNVPVGGGNPMSGPSGSGGPANSYNSGGNAQATRPVVQITALPSTGTGPPSGPAPCNVLEKQPTNP